MSPFDVTATVRYLMSTDQRPIYFASRAGADAQFDIDVGFDARDVTISDARSMSPQPGLDVQGFALLSHSTKVTDFYDLEAQRETYQRELTTLVCDALGADAARVFDHTLRSDSSTVRGARNTREPAGFIHNDYTDSSARKRLYDVLDPVEADTRSQSRFAIVNVWRAIQAPVLSSPIACCDASTLAPDDLIAAERRAEGRIGEIEFARWNSAHRWYYFPLMNADEVLLIKTFDSASDGRARRCIHTAFNNPLAPDNAAPRESIESRLLVFF